MGPKKRKISDLTPDDTTILLRTLTEFEDALDEDDEDLPEGLLPALQKLREKLAVVKHTSFSKVDALTLVNVNITNGPLFLIPEKQQSVETRGATDNPNAVLSISCLTSFIWLVRGHVSTVSEAGCRILINLVLLRVSEFMSHGGLSVNIIPEFPIPRTPFPGNMSFGGVVDFLLTKLSDRYTSYLLGNPMMALGGSAQIEGPVSSNIFEAKRDNVRAAVPQAVMAAAAHCRQQNIPALRGCVTSGEQWIFFIYNAKENGGGHVSVSEQYSIGNNYEGLPLILGLLCDWVDNADKLQTDIFTLK